MPKAPCNYACRYREIDIDTKKRRTWVFVPGLCYEDSKVLKCVELWSGAPRTPCRLSRGSTKAWVATTMADTLLLPALKSQPRVLNLCNKKLNKVPKAIGRLKCVVQLLLKNNNIKDLPSQFGELTQVNKNRKFVRVWLVTWVDLPMCQNWVVIGPIPARFWHIMACLRLTNGMTGIDLILGSIYVGMLSHLSTRHGLSQSAPAVGWGSPLHAWLASARGGHSVRFHTGVCSSGVRTLTLF